MTTKITLDPALVRSVLGMNKYVDNNTEAEVVITCLRNGINICGDAGLEDWLYTRDGFIMWNEGGAWIDYHRVKDKAIEWCAGKGWEIIPYKNEVVIMLPITDPKSEGRPRMIFRIAEGFYPDKLSAELAAISFVWEQIQEGKNQ